MRLTLTALAAAVFAPMVLPAQSGTARAAQEAYAALDYESVIVLAQQALTESLGRSERVDVFELLGYSYAALDSTRRAVEAFRELIFLDPDREPDPARVSPRITSLYASALGQVLVVRRMRMDSASFIAGRGTAALGFEVSQPASAVITRVVGGDIDRRIDSAAVAAEGRVEWDGLGADGLPVPAGSYRLVVEARAGRNEYALQLPIEVTHGTVDTMAHLMSVPGYTRQAEVRIPPRNWRPLGVAALFTAVAAGGSLALENTNLGGPGRTELGIVSAAALLTGFVLSIRRPDPEPVPSGILYNRLLDEELARRNAEIAEQNAQRRRQVMLTVRAQPRAP